MDSEQASEVLDVSEVPQQEEAIMESEGKLDATGESREPENPPAAVEDTEQLAVNGHATEAASVMETDEPAFVETTKQENEEMTIEDSLEKLVIESVPCVMAPVEPDESSEKVSGPEPENTKQQSVPENKPEPLAESPEPEPEKPLPETEEQTSTVSVEVQQPVDVQPPKQEEKLLEKVEAEMEQQAAMEPVAKKEATETVTVTEVSPNEAATVEKEAPAGIGGGDTTQEKESPAPKEAEPEIEVKSEPEAEPPSAEVSPAAGSLSFALLDQEQTKDALRSSRVLVVLKGLPGSGLSFLARAISDSYNTQCSVICADDHGVKPDRPESSADGYKALDDAVVACCSQRETSPVFIVVDDTNHTHDRLARLGEIAKEQRLLPIFLEPRTQWSRDVAQLKAKTKRALEESQLKAMQTSLQETNLPLYFGWFFTSDAEEKLTSISMDFLTTLDTLDVFKEHQSDFAGKPGKDLKELFNPKGILHCTTKFCNYGKVEGAQEYAEMPVVQKSYGSAFELSLTALFVTPRTVGARVSLTQEQLELWPGDAEKQVDSAAAALPSGSRAHVTLGCADGVQSVQTGIDLLQILALQQEGKQGEQKELELGSLVYYNEGRWLLSLKEPVRLIACFSSFYGRKEPGATKKDPEKKKKQKCCIL